MSFYQSSFYYLSCFQNFLSFNINFILLLMVLVLSNVYLNTSYMIDCRLFHYMKFVLGELVPRELCTHGFNYHLCVENPSTFPSTYLKSNTTQYKLLAFHTSTNSPPRFLMWPMALLFIQLLIFRDQISQFSFIFNWHQIHESVPLSIFIKYLLNYFFLMA